MQALAGLLLSSVSVFLLLLCNDRQVLGPWVNKRRLNVLAVAIVAVLILLSAILMTTTLFPDADVVTLSIWLAVSIAAAGAIAVTALR